MRQVAARSLVAGSILCISLLMSGCSLRLPDFLAIPTTPPTRTPTAVLTATESPTTTPTLPSPTFTFTPTLIGAKSPTPTLPTATVAPILITATSGTATPSPEMDGFSVIRLSANEFYAARCEPTGVEFTAHVGDPGRVVFAVLFARFKSTVTGATSPWTSITMKNGGGGTYSHRLTAVEMTGFDSFEDPWVQYQLVTADSKSRVLGRTQIFDEALRLWTSCTPTATATINP